MLETIDQTQETAILDSFLELVKSPYGDFSTIGKLAQALMNNPTILQDVVDYLSQTPEGQQVFIDRPLLGEINLQQLHQLPTHTLGHLYADHMLKNGFTPKAVNRAIDDPLTFLSTHISETHDIWHVVTGCNVDKVGEVTLEAFYVAQLGPDRFFLTLLTKNLLKTALYEIELREPLMNGLTQGWMMGKQAKPLFGIQWNKLWKHSLEELKIAFNIPSAITP